MVSEKDKQAQAKAEHQQEKNDDKEQDFQNLKMRKTMDNDSQLPVPNSAASLIKQVVEPDRSVEPEERLEQHVRLTRGLFHSSKKAENCGKWLLGHIYITARRDPGVYGREKPLTISDLQDMVVDWSTGKIDQCKLLRNVYDTDQIQKYGGLPTRVLLKATELPATERNPLLGEAVARKKRGDLQRGEAYRVVKGAIKERQKISEVDETDSGRSGWATLTEPGPTGSKVEGEHSKEEAKESSSCTPPPVDALQNRASKVRDTARDILKGVEDRYLFTTEEIEDLEGVADTLREVAEDLEEVATRARN